MSRPSPLQNRVAPDGTLHAVPARGLLMGNRGGRLHDADRRLGRARWRSRAWIACVTEFRGRHRDVMGAGYTELFFLDEATALAAGHRPCFECRRAEASAFARAFAGALGTEAPPRAATMDTLLHCERTDRLEADWLKARPRLQRLIDVPPGAIISRAGAFFLRMPAGLRRWTFTGYGPADATVPDREAVAVVTPATICAVLATGYRPMLHPSATS